MKAPPKARRGDMKRGQLYILPPYRRSDGLGPVLLLTHFYKNGLRFKVLAKGDKPWMRCLYLRAVLTIVYDTELLRKLKPISYTELPLYIDSATQWYTEFFEKGCSYPYKGRPSIPVA